MNKDERRRWCDRLFNAYEVKCDRVAPYRNMDDASLSKICREKSGLSDDMLKCSDARNAYEKYPIWDGSEAITRRPCADILKKLYRDSHLFEAEEMSRRAELCDEASRSPVASVRPQSQAYSQAPLQAPPPDTPVKTTPSRFGQVSSGESDNDVQEEVPAAPEAPEVSSGKNARRKRQKERREKKRIEALLEQTALEAQSELKIAPVTVLYWISTQLKFFLAYACQEAQTLRLFEDIDPSFSTFVSNWREQRLRSEQLRVFHEYLDTLRGALQGLPQLLPQFEKLAAELELSLQKNIDSFRSEAFEDGDNDLFLTLVENLLMGGDVVASELQGDGLLIFRPTLTSELAHQFDPKGLINKNTGILALLCDGHSTRIAASWIDRETSRAIDRCFECCGSLREIPIKLLDGAPNFRISFSRVLNLQGVNAKENTSGDIPEQLRGVWRLRSKTENCILIAQFQRVQKHDQPPNALPPNCCDFSLPFSFEHVFVVDQVNTGLCIDFLDCTHTWRNPEATVSLSDESLWSILENEVEIHLTQAQECVKLLRKEQPALGWNIDTSRLGKVCWKEPPHNTCWQMAYIRPGGACETLISPHQPIFIVTLSIAHQSRLLFLVPIETIYNGKHVKCYVPYCSPEAFLDPSSARSKSSSPLSLELLFIQSISAIERRQDSQLQILLYDLATGKTEEVSSEVLLKERSKRVVDKLTLDLIKEGKNYEDK